MMIGKQGGLLARLGEEADTPIRFLLAEAGEEAIRHTADEPGPSAS